MRRRDHTAAGLARALAAEGHLADPRWRDAFESVPRHVFVPRFLRDDNTPVDAARPGDRDEWLAAVYTDVALTTQSRPVRGTDLQWPTSSSTRPSLMARMLHLLETADGQRVLEIGTGTGYNAALLCRRLGEANVTSIDIDPDLVDQARARLASLGYRPHLYTGDGTAGVARDAPYHRIIATAAVAAVPPAWIDQLLPAGVIVADIRGELSSSLAVLRRTDPGTVEGRFLGLPGHFMWLRPVADSPLRTTGAFRSTIDRDSATRMASQLDPSTVDSLDLRFMLQHLHAIEQIWATHRGEIQVTHLHAADGSWAEVETAPDGSHAATQGGPRPLWSRTEETVRLWSRLGRPGRDRFGLTAHRNGRQRLWLDRPDGEHAWPLG